MTFMIVIITGYCLSCRFFVVNVAIVYFYFSIFQRINEEEFGGMSEIMKEGLMTSFATFIVCIALAAFCVA